MQRIINFILTFRNAFLYLFLVFISFFLTIRSHSYHQSKFVNSSKWVSGNVYALSNSVSTYFNLREENVLLLEENRILRDSLFNRKSGVFLLTDTTSFNFRVTSARVIKNSFAGARNYLTIDAGKRKGVQQDMGVVTHKGILGIVENTSNNYATVQSILNTKSRINAKIKNTNYFGSLQWDGRRYDVVQLEEVPRLVPLVVGDTVVTGSRSSIFPEGIPIGVIKKYDLNDSKSLYNIDVSLFNDMTNLGGVYLVHHKKRDEILQLESRTEDNE